MKRIALAVTLAASAAHAGEVYRGIIVSAAGADTTNASTAAPFVVTAREKVTVVCNAAAFICIGSATCTASLAGANPGVPVASNEKFPTSTGSLVSGVTVSGATTALIRIVSTTAVSCLVWTRQGDE